MKRRQAKKILTRWSRDFDGSDSPVDARKDGRLPWRWGTWVKAHQVWLRRARWPKRAVISMTTSRRTT